MILHPGIIALLFGSFIVLLLMLRAGVVALEILWRWDSASSSAVQLRLERRTWLVSTLLNYAFAFQIFSLFLFIFTADDIHRLFIGAMCATGALNANLVGWLVLLLKVGMLFAAGIWLAVNHLDQCTEDTPLVRRKYVWLLLLIPVVLLDLLLQWEYFRGLRPQMITSCCGSLFSSSGEGVMSSLTGLAPLPAAALFFGTVLLYLLLLITTMVRRAIFLRYLLFVAALLLFFAGMLGLVSFLSLYIYQMPGHHCPFDMLQGHYGFIGYPIYAGLFLATLAAMLPGICHPLARGSTSLTRELERCEKLWLRLALFGVLLFLLCACWQMVFGPLVLFGY
ncbi:MAG: hypothetical protein R6W66_12325 [Pelovirga sp.]